MAVSNKDVDAVRSLPKEEVDVKQEAMVCIFYLHAVLY